MEKREKTGKKRKIKKNFGEKKKQEIRGKKTGKKRKIRRKTGKKR